MKKLVFLAIMLIQFVLPAQNYQLEIRLVDANVGYPTGDWSNNYPATSNDSGLNSIFTTYNAISYIPGNGQTYITQYIDRTHFVQCTGCDVNAFEQALINYSAVVENINHCELNTVNALYVLLISLDNGTNTGTTTSEGIVITDNAELNIIFEDFKVMYYEQAFPSSQNQTLLRVYTAACDCDARLLKPVLELETETIEDVEGPLGIVFLANEDFENLDFEFYPNPVGDNIIINSKEDIESFELFNLLGQSMFKADTEEQLKSDILLLSSGNYLLKVITKSGATETFRLLKK